MAVAIDELQISAAMGLAQIRTIQPTAEKTPRCIVAIHKIATLKLVQNAALGSVCVVRVHDINLSVFY